MARYLSSYSEDLLPKFDCSITKQTKTHTTTTHEPHQKEHWVFINTKSCVQPHKSDLHINSISHATEFVNKMTPNNS